MAGLGLGGLPGVPSAAAGIPQTNPLAQLLQAVGQFPQQQQDAGFEKQRRQALLDQQKAVAEDRQAQVAERKTKAAQFGYDALVEQAKNAPGIAKYPEWQSKFAEHSGVLGIPVPKAADGSIDTTAFQPKKSFWDMPAEEREAFNAADPVTRKAMRDSGRITGITDEQINQAPYVTPGSAQWQRLQNVVGQVLDRAEKGATPEQFGVEWERIKSARESLGMFEPPPAAMTNMSRSLRAKVELLEAQGAVIPQKAKIALDNAKSLNDYRKAEAQLLGIKGRELPMMDQARMQRWSSETRIAEGNLAVRQASLKARVAQGGVNPGHAIGIMQSEEDKLRKEVELSENRVTDINRTLLAQDTQDADKTSPTYKALLDSRDRAIALHNAQAHTFNEYAKQTHQPIQAYLEKVTGKKIALPDSSMAPIEAIPRDAAPATPGTPAADASKPGTGHFLTVDAVRQAAKAQKKTYAQAKKDAEALGYDVR